VNVVGYIRVSTQRHVGVDLHKHHLTAVIINCWKEKLGEIQFDNKPSAFSKFL